MCELQIQLRLFHLSLGSLHGGLGGKIRLDIVVQLTLSNGPLLRQRSIPVHIELGFAQLRFGLRELCLGLIEHRLKGARIDLEEHLALANKGAFFVALLDEIPTYLRLDLRVDVPIQRRNPFAVDGDVFLNDADNFHLDGRWWGSRLRALTTQKHSGAWHREQSPNPKKLFGNDT